MKILNQWVMLGLVLLLSSCAQQTYQFAHSEPFAKLRYLADYPLEMCIDHKIYDLPQTEDGHYYKLPVSGHVSLRSKITEFEDLGVIIHFASCNPTIALIPQRNQLYIADIAVHESKSCTLDIVRQINSKRTGIEIEPTLLKDRCFASS